MRVKREYLTEAPIEQIIERVAAKFGVRTVEKLVTDPIVIKRLAQIENLVREILTHETADEGPEEPDQEILDILARLDRLNEKVEQAANTPPPTPAPPPKQPYQFDVVRNAAGDIERIVARPLAGGNTIYGGAR